MIKTIGCFFRGRGFSSQNPCGGSQSSVTRVSADLMPSSGLHSHQTCTDKHAGKSNHAHKINKPLKKKREGSSLLRNNLCFHFPVLPTKETLSLVVVDNSGADY